MSSSDQPHSDQPARFRPQPGYRRRSSRRDPIRSAGNRHDVRRSSLAERDRLFGELDRVDNELAELTQRRCALADRLAELREKLWPTVLHRRGRRPDVTGGPAVPPLPEQPTWLYGRRLRSVCLALLRRAGRLTLPKLHALLHAHGYGVDATYAAKTLSDTMGYEVECGRARRVRRGEYEIAGPPPREGRHGAPSLEPAQPDPEDRLLDETLSPAPYPDAAR